MLSNVACSSSGCTNPVVGQCGGYKKNCGSFYCAVHSKDKLCSECSKRKAQDDLVDEYYQSAVKLESEAKHQVYWKFFLVNLFFVGALVYLVLSYINILQEDYVANEFVQYSTVISCVLVFFVSPISRLVQWISETRMKERLANDLNETKPQFSEFYKIYKSEKRKENLRLAGSIAMGVIASAAADAQRSYERQRKEEMIRKAVDDELNRHGL